MATATQQLCEFHDFIGYETFQVLDEAKSDGRMVVRGVFQRADTKNANGRIYTSSLWDRLLKDESLNQTIQYGRMLGEVEHPQSGTTHLTRVSHKINRLWRQGNEILGEAVILNTPSGQVIQELIRAGCQVGISSRGRGTSQIRGGVEYVDEGNYQLDTFDFVYKPSTPGAYVNLKEAVQAPYRADSSMETKMDELKRLDVRAADIRKGVSGSDLKALNAFYTECVELDEKSQTLLNQLGEGAEEAAYAKEVREKVLAARQEVTSALDKAHLSSKLDSRIDTTVDNILGDKKESQDDRVKRLLDLLGEVRAQRDYFSGRFTETKEILAASDDQLKVRYAAAVTLGEELLARLADAEDALAEQSQVHQMLGKRYEAAVEMLAGINQRQDKAKLIRRVREAIEEYPELAKLQKSLLSCKTEDELEERISEYVDALDLPAQSKDEAMTGQVMIAAVEEPQTEIKPVKQETKEEARVLGENADLPNARSSINETEENPVLRQVVKELSERVSEGPTNNGVAVARAALRRRPGWK